MMRAGNRQQISFEYAWEGGAMDHESFDRLTRVLGALGSRRAALGALLGAGALGVTEATAARNKRKRGNGRKGKRGGVSAQAVCAPPGHGLNRNNCDYTGEDFSGQDIASSNYRNTIFRDATLIETDLSSSSARGAIFTNANLCGADLSSSTLREANFDQANLALADLSSSSCGGAVFTASTFWCNTLDCNGNLRNDDCPGGLPSNLCCTPCGAGEECVNNECVAVCDEGATQTSCDCKNAWDNGSAGDPVCVNNIGLCGQPTCTSDANCTGGAVCTFTTCCPESGRCAPPCPSLDECTCVGGPPACGGGFRCGETTTAAARTSRGSADKEFAP
jgi:hypothetical protein